jgi:large subunit ribosomal protein L18
MRKITKSIKRIRRHARIRKVVKGTATRPRLSVFRSLTGMYVQLIDDNSGKTLISADTKTLADGGDVGDRKGKVAKSYLLGKELAKKAEVANISNVVFDRGGNRYHGRISAFADGAREGGLQF